MTKIICYDDYCTWNVANECTCDEITLEVNPDTDPDKSAINKCNQFFKEN